MADQPKLGELLVEAGLIDDMQLRSALGHQRRWGGRLGSALINLGFINESELIRFMSEKLKFSAIDLSQSNIAPKTFEALPRKVAEQYKVVPVVLRDGPGKKTLVVAMSDPTDLTMIAELEFATNCRIEPVVALDSAIANVLKNYGQSPVQGASGAVGLELTDPGAGSDEQLEVMRDNMDQVQETVRRPEPPPPPPRPESSPADAPAFDLGEPSPEELDAATAAEPEKISLEEIEEPPAPRKTDTLEFGEFDDPSAPPAQASPPPAPVAGEPDMDGIGMQVARLTQRIARLENLLLRLSQGQLTMEELEKELKTKRS